MCRHPRHLAGTASGSWSVQVRFLASGGFMSSRMVSDDGLVVGDELRSSAASFCPSSLFDISVSRS